MVRCDGWTEGTEAGRTLTTRDRRTVGALGQGDRLPRLQVPFPLFFFNRSFVDATRRHCMGLSLSVHGSLATSHRIASYLFAHIDHTRTHTRIASHGRHSIPQAFDTTSTVHLAFFLPSFSTLQSPRRTRIHRHAWHRHGGSADAVSGVFPPLATTRSTVFGIILVDMGHRLRFVGSTFLDLIIISPFPVFPPVVASQACAHD